MQSFKTKDQIELAHILEEPVKRLDEDLDEVQQGERGFGGGRDKDEVERSIVPVGDLGRCVRRRRRASWSKEGWQGEEVAGRRWPRKNEVEDLSQKGLLSRRVLLEISPNSSRVSNT